MDEKEREKKCKTEAIGGVLRGEGTKHLKT